jgi:hypothetical protein
MLYQEKAITGQARIPDGTTEVTQVKALFGDVDTTADAIRSTPARRSAAADAKASRQRDAAIRPTVASAACSHTSPTLTRNQVLFAGAPAAVPVLTKPTSEQRRAFDLIGAPIPLALKK